MSEGTKNKSAQADTGRGGSFNEIVAAAHELKTPLAVIAQLAASIDDDLLKATPYERRVVVDRIRLSAERSLRLVEGLTLTHRLTFNDQLAFQFACEPVNSLQICEEAIHEIGPFAKAYTQNIELVAYASRPQLVVGNKELLRSVFMNLLDNAIKHNPPNTTISMSVRRRSQFVRICVRDSGPGLRPNDISKLKQTLGQELQPLHGRAGTSGLGLYIAGQMVQAMGGRLGLGILKAGQGADFHVDLLYSKQLSLL